MGQPNVHHIFSAKSASRMTNYAMGVFSHSAIDIHRVWLLACEKSYNSPFRYSNQKIG